MSETNSDKGAGVLRRMVGADTRPKPPPLTVHRALRLALGQLADERLDIDIEVRGIEDRKAGQQEVGALRLPHAVYFLVEGAAGGTGIAIASRDMVAALVEVQTTGRISAAPGPERAPTPTDAAMVEGYVDAVLVRLGTMLSAVEGEEWTCGQRLGRPVFDLHQIPLELPDITYRVLRAAIGFAPDGKHDGKQGELVIALPADPAALAAADLGPQAADAARLWHQRLGAAVMGSPAELSAVLHRLRLPVAAIRAMKVGEFVPVPARAARSIALEGRDGHVAATGRLGMANGMKAVRIAAIGSAPPPEPKLDAPPEAPGAIDLDRLGLGDFPDPPAALDAPAFNAPIVTPDDLPDLGDLPTVATEAGADGLGADGTIPLDDLPELDGDLPPLEIAPMKIEID